MDEELKLRNFGIFTAILFILMCFLWSFFLFSGEYGIAWIPFSIGLYLVSVLKLFYDLEEEDDMI